MTQLELYFGAEIARLCSAVSRGLIGMSEYSRQGPEVKRLFRCGYAAADEWLKYTWSDLSEPEVWEQSFAKHANLIQIGINEPKEPTWCHGWEARVLDHVNMRKTSCTT